MDKQSAYSHIVVQFCLGLDPVGDICCFFSLETEKKTGKSIQKLKNMLSEQQEKCWMHFTQNEIKRKSFKDSFI